MRNSRSLGSGNLSAGLQSFGREAKASGRMSGSRWANSCEALGFSSLQICRSVRFPNQISAYGVSDGVYGIGIEQRHPHGRIGLAMPPDSLSTPLRLITIFTRSAPELAGYECLRPPLVLIKTLTFGT